MIFNKWFKNKSEKIGLLPYISEPVYGLKPTDPQTMGWEITKFDIPKAWSYSQGEGVVCAVLDTGCDLSHDDLKDNLLDGKNFIEKNQSPIDVAGHGTHVCSTISASNNEKGIVGVAPKTKIVPVKVLDNNGQGSINSIVEGIYWSCEQKNVNFITMSLGSPSSHKEIEKAINYASNKGKVIFCAAGNSGPDSDIMYPAKYANTIAIGAIDINMNRTSFSCSGDSLDFLAPGDNILGCIPKNRYAKMSGTSMSNPFAVGIASLLLSYNLKNKKYQLVNCQDYINVFKKHTTSLKSIEHRSKKYQGYGILNPVKY
jgi:subtilisin family serine protease